MNRNGSKKGRKKVIRVWTYDQAKKAVPYITSVVRSLREHRIDALNENREAKELAGKPGRPDRTALIEHAELTRRAREADGRFDNAMAELNALDVFCIDPLRGEAVVPFVHGEQLAWYLFDLFDEEDPLRYWRFHEDPLETRRPISEALAAPETAA
ncbi:MAG: DUF2203 family protein [Planctomycetia bacterium]|nr:DUF2203 family protein [Planctomycetia bacterium]